MSNRVLRFINNTSHNEPLDTNQKGDILRTGENEYSVRIDKSYHVLTDNVKTIETDEYLQAEKTDNTVNLSIDEPQMIELIKNNCCDETDYEKQILNDNIGEIFKTNGNVFRYKEHINKSKIDSFVGDYVIELNDINNVYNKHDNGESFHETFVYTSEGSSMLPINVILDENGLRLRISKLILDHLILSESDMLSIDYTGILDFVDNDDDPPVV